MSGNDDNQVHDLWAEVERMAQATHAQDAQIADEYPSPEAIARWKKLFGYSHMEAVKLISAQRADVMRERIMDEHWSLVAAEKEALGYDREAYEHSLQLPSVFKGHSATIPTTDDNGTMMFLFRLGGLMDSPKKVKEIAGLEELPTIVKGMSEMGVAEFCLVDEEAKKRLEEWLVQEAVLQK